MKKEKEKVNENVNVNVNESSKSEKANERMSQKTTEGMTRKIRIGEVSDSDRKGHGCGREGEPLSPLPPKRGRASYGENHAGKEKQVRAESGVVRGSHPDGSVICHPSSVIPQTKRSGAERQTLQTAQSAKPRSLLRVNSFLCVDLKTLLRTDRVAKKGKCYEGVMKRDGEDHFLFVEMESRITYKRHPHAYNGKYITVTQHEDGTFRTHFRPVVISSGFDVNKYANDVYYEIHQALSGLVEK